MMILLREQKRSGRKVCSGHDNKEADVTEISYIRSIWSVRPIEISPEIPEFMGFARHWPYFFALF